MFSDEEDIDEIRHKRVLSCRPLVTSLNSAKPGRCGRGMCNTYTERKYYYIAWNSTKTYSDLSLNCNCYRVSGGVVAQWLERATDNRVVAGSNPTGAAWKLWQFPLPHVATVFWKRR